MDIRERTCIGHHRTPARPDTPPRGTAPSGHRAIAPPGRTREATGHHTEKDCGERRKDHIMRCRRGGTPRGSRTVVFLYGYIVTYGYIVADVPRDNRITAPPRRRHEAMRHKTEKECGERRKDRRMRHDGRRHNAMRHGPARLGSPPPGVPRLPTTRRVQQSGILKARCLPCPGPTRPVADAANRCVRTLILLYGRGASSWPVRRRG